MNGMKWPLARPIGTRVSRAMPVLLVAAAASRDVPGGLVPAERHITPWRTYAPARLMRWFRTGWRRGRRGVRGRRTGTSACIGVYLPISA